MSKDFKAVITDFITGDLSPECDVIGDIANVTAMDAHNEEQLTGSIEDADAIMLYHNLTISRKTIEKLTNCKLIVRCGVGYDNVDHAFARQRGIPVANVPDYGTEEVADTAIGMLLSLSRGIHLLNHRLQRAQGPWMYTQVQPLQRLRGCTFAIVGLGRIGSAVALRAKAIGMHVIYFDPTLPDGYDKALGVERVETVDELFSRADVLSLHCPLTDQTRHIVNGESIQLLPKGAYLINTARGAGVDVNCIPDAIASGQLAGAGIDVLEGEPPADDQPLLQAWRDPTHPAYDRLIINPHAAFYCEQGLMEMRVKGAQACRRALLSEPIRNVVN